MRALRQEVDVLAKELEHAREQHCQELVSLRKTLSDHYENASFLLPCFILWTMPLLCFLWTMSLLCLSVTVVG